MKKLKILVGCEFSGIVREAFRAKGHDAFSCDLLPAEDGSKYHIQGDVLLFLRDGWDLAIFHPPCTYLAASGLHWNGRVEGREAQTIAALEFVRKLMDASKKTCLWLKRLPKLVETNRFPGDNKTRRANQTESGQNRLTPSPDRWKERSRTYPGIANAMASQWSVE